MRRFNLGLLSGVGLLLAAGSAAALSDDAKAATGSLVTLLGVAVLIWVFGNLFTYYRYDVRGPKGDNIPKH